MTMICGKQVKVKGNKRQNLSKIIQGAMTNAREDSKMLILSIQ